MWPFPEHPDERIAQKLKERSDALSTAKPYNAAEHAQFIQATASEIVSRISAGDWTASAVLEAYIARAAQAHAATNGLTEVMFDAARERARALDDAFTATGKLTGPLHGVPMTLKDTFNVVGFDTTIGFTQWIGRRPTKDADAVKLILEAGAIPFAKTNVPQTLLSFECSNPLWGRTTNPYSKDYTSGGSSGGEGALLALHGSALGLDTDIGGSLRLPAAFCGVYSLKPGHGRVPYVGVQSCFGGFKSVPLVAGPMARSVGDLVLLSKVLFGKQCSDHHVAPVPYRNVVLPQKLKFGYYIDDGFVKASPACARAVNQAVEALRSNGHECIEIDWSFNSEPAQIFSGLISADGYRTLFSPVGPDAIDDSLSMLHLLTKLPGIVRSALAWVVGSVVGDPQFASFVHEGRVKSVFELYKLVERRDALVRRLNSEVFDAMGLDGIISPVMALPGIQHHAAKDVASLSNMCMIYNLADCTAGVISVTRVDPALDALPKGYWPEGAGSKLLAKACTSLYDAQKMAGLPVGIQIAGRKWEDEKVLEMMRVVDNALGRHGIGSGPACMINAQELEILNQC